jgi:hypothetical protein
MTMTMNLCQMMIIKPAFCLASVYSFCIWQISMTLESHSFPILDLVLIYFFSRLYPLAICFNLGFCEFHPAVKYLRVILLIVVVANVKYRGNRGKLVLTADSRLNLDFIC